MPTTNQKQACLPQRQVKLQPKHRSLSYGQKIVPELKLFGLWLEAAGFKAGEKVLIRIENRQLIITTLNPEVL